MLKIKYYDQIENNKVSKLYPELIASQACLLFVGVLWQINLSSVIYSISDNANNVSGYRITTLWQEITISMSLQPQNIKTRGAHRATVLVPSPICSFSLFGHFWWNQMTKIYKRFHLLDKPTRCPPTSHTKRLSWNRSHGLIIYFKITQYLLEKKGSLNICRMSQ